MECDANGSGTIRTSLPSSGIVNPTPNHEPDSHPEPYVEDDCDQDVVFSEDEEEEEGYLFVGQDDKSDMDDQSDIDLNDTIEPDVAEQDPYSKVYANVPSEIHMLKPVDNCEHCNAKKF
ncbi:hypothetical protein PVAP13_8KG214568 [Panicum virgatum]|uniref:Uncharacterized protein n=1 Tax=Panicum virgatum TaxID=38727 RepID=A0A8T0PKR7_PANVG|nr:hypothetical protein PVAP13_8KG214568 [Panicum virgatum]